MDDATGVLSALRAAFDQFFADFDAATRQVDGGWEVIGIHDAVALSESTARLTTAICHAYLWLFDTCGTVISEFPKDVTAEQRRSSDGSTKPLGAERVRTGTLRSDVAPRLRAALDKAQEVIVLPADKQHQKQRWRKGDVIPAESLSLLKSAAKSLDLHDTTLAAGQPSDGRDSRTTATGKVGMNESLDALLQRAADVFRLAGQLSDEFAEGMQGGFVAHDPSKLARTKSQFGELCASLGKLGNAINRPPAGFEAVADWLSRADVLARTLRDASEFHVIRDSFPALNSISLGGSTAVSAALKQSRQGNPLAFADESPGDRSTEQTSLQKKYPNTTAGHVAFLEFVRDEVHYASDAKRNQFAKGYPNSTIESMVRGIYWSDGIQRINELHDTLPAEAVEGVARVLRRELSPGTVEQIDGLLTPVVATLRDAWERLRDSGAECAVAVVTTAGDLWKALDSGQEPKVAGSAMRVRPGNNTLQVSFVDESDEARRLAFEHLMALLRYKGGDKAATMHEMLVRVQIESGLDWASTVNMPLSEFVAALTSSTVSPRDKFRGAIENDPATKRAWQRAKALLQDFSTAMNRLSGTSEFRDADQLKRRQWQDLSDAIRSAIEQGESELVSRHLPLPQSIDDWEHLARLVEIPAARIDEGLTAGEIFDAALAWADRQIIRHKLTHGATPDPNANTAAIDARKSKRNRGRPKSDYETVQQEARIAADWKRARDAGVFKADFAKEKGVALKDLDALLDRVAKRKKSSE